MSCLFAHYERKAQWCITGCVNDALYAAGGRLQLVSMPGYGIDAYLNLKRLEGDWQEQHAEPAASLLTISGNDTRGNAR